MQQLRDIITKYDVDMMIPASDKAMRLVLENYGELEKLVILSCPPPAICQIILNKEQTLIAARRCGIRTPNTFNIATMDGLLERESTLRFPLIAKPASAGLKSRFKLAYFGSFAHLMIAYQDDPAFGAGIIFQDYIQGEGVGVSTVMAAGVPLGLFAHRRIHEWPADGGVGVLIQSHPIDAKLSNAAIELLQQLQWEGPAMVEFRQDATGEPFFMEVNGRFWGSLPLAMYAGFDFPYYWWQATHGEQPEIPSSYKPGLKMRWTSGEVLRLQELLTDTNARERTGISRLKAVEQFASSFSPSVRSAVFDWSDPRPAVAEAASAVRGLLAVLASPLLKIMMPRPTRLRLRQLRQLDQKARWAYIQLWLERALGLRSTKRKRQLVTVSTTLFVCKGNRIRSPLAASYFSSLRSSEQVASSVVSAGTRAAPESGYDPRIRDLCTVWGLQLAGSPQLISRPLVEEADLIIVMDYVIEAEALSTFPQAKNKLFLLNEFSDPSMIDHEILDPDTDLSDEFARKIAAVRSGVECLHTWLSARS